MSGEEEKDLGWLGFDPEEEWAKNELRLRLGGTTDPAPAARVLTRPTPLDLGPDGIPLGWVLPPDSPEIDPLPWRGRIGQWFVRLGGRRG